MRRTRTHGAAAALAIAMLVVLSGLPAWGAAPLPRDVRVVDVTPSAFTVIWVTDVASTASIEVYADVLGTLPLSPVIEPSLVFAGDSAIAAAAEDLGVLRVRVSGLESRTPYFFRTLTTPKAGGPAEPLPAAGALYSTVTANSSTAPSAKALGAELVDTDGSTPLPGALLLVEVPGALSPISALGGDGYPAGLAAVNLANLYDASSGDALLTTGGESVQITALAGVGRTVSLSSSLDLNDDSGLLQRPGAPLVLQLVVDTDLDGMPDDYETANGLNPGGNDSAGNPDLDGLSNGEEYAQGTDPNVADSDGDGLSDGDEVNLHGTLPTEVDTDRDGRSDGDEVNGPVFTDPLDADSDDDGVSDGVEVANGTDPNDSGDFPILDGDGDGIGDLTDNCSSVPNPSQADTDLDGFGDACDGDDDADGLADGLDNCPLATNAGQEDLDLDTVGDLCDNCPADANLAQADNESDGLGDVCDPDDDNDGVDDYQAAPPPSDIPFSYTSATGIVSTSLPVVGVDQAYVSVEKFIVAESRSIRLGFFDLKDRTFSPSTVSPADQALVGWLALGIDINVCGCFQIAAGDSITIDTDSGNITAVLAADIQAVPSLIFVSDDGSTFTQYYTPDGPLATLSQSSQVAGPLDNCQFVVNPLQEDTDGDGIGDLCDITIDDLDGDNVLNVADNCPNTHNPAQQDLDLDGQGDACDPDDDNDGVADVDEISLGTDPTSADTDGDGIPDGTEDFDFDGRDNADELNLGRSPFDPDVELAAGLNLFAYPIQVPPALGAFDLLLALGSDTEVVGVRRLDPATQTFEEASYVGGVPQGIDFPIVAAEGYLVEMSVGKTVTFSGPPSCPTHDLLAGGNLIGFGCFPGGFTTRSLLSHFGDQDTIASAQTFDTTTGRFATVTWLGASPSGPLVPVAAGRGLFVHSQIDRLGVAPPITPPTVTITDPIDLSTTDTTPITVSGTVDPPDAVVTVNGLVATVDGLGGYTVSGVPLVEGPNTITAGARTVENLTSSASIDITLDTSVPLDYTLNRPDSVADSRAFNVGANVLTGLDHFHVSLTNVPAGVTFSPASISLNIGSGDVTAPYTISTDAAATVGVHTFQADYIFHDAVETVLANHVLEFTIEVLP